MKRIFITIYILLILVYIAIPFGIGSILEKIFEDEIITADIELSKGTFYLISERLEALEENQWPDEMVHLESRFGYPVRLRPLKDLDLSSEDIQGLKEGEIIVGEKDQLIQRLASTERVIIIEGPFPGEELDTLAISLYFGFGVIFLILPAMAWTYLLKRDVKKIQLASNQFASGQHSARIPISRFSQLDSISKAFNTMAEKTQLLLSSQKEFANSLSHEIRTPLARIKFSLEMMRDAIAPNQDAERYHDKIRNDSQEIETLVDDMLTYARFERENESAEDLLQHEMVTWIENIIQAEKGNLTKTPVLFENLLNRPSFFVAFEPKYLGWALKNIIRNAGRYARSTIMITLDHADETCFIHVEDDGPDIPEKDRDHIFKPFFRVDKSRSKHSGGYGLGLSIARGIMKWHKGDIRVDTSRLSGARFTLTLPSNTT